MEDVKFADDTKIDRVVNSEEVVLVCRKIEMDWSDGQINNRWNLILKSVR